MSDVPQYPSDVIEKLQQELAEIDRDLEAGGDLGRDGSEEDLRVASVLAAEGRFSRTSGEVVDDLLADDDSTAPQLRARLVGTVDEELAERRLLHGALEPILVSRRKGLGLEPDSLRDAVSAALPDGFTVPDADHFRRAEVGAIRFDQLLDDEPVADSEGKGADLMASWIRVLDLDGGAAVAALEQSLPELAGAGFGGGDATRRTSARAFVRAVAERLGVEYGAD